MVRGVLVAVVLGGLTWDAGAEELSRTQRMGARATEARDAERLQDFRIRGPLTFDVAVRSLDGRTAIYRYDRARRTALAVERLEDTDVPRRTQGFQSLTEQRIVLPPEGHRTPPSPLTPGRPTSGWSLPDTERAAALAAVKELEPEGQVLSIGQIQASTP